MTQTTLLVASLIAVASAVLYAYLGYRLGRRDVDPEAKVASSAFAFWWLAIAVSTVLTAVLTILAAFGALDLDLYLAATNVQLAVVTFGLASLLYYLIYLFAGRVRFTWLLVLSYLVYFGVLAYWIQWSEPIGVKVQPWQVGLDTRRPQEGPFFLAVVILLIGPQVVAALAYFSLLFRVKGRTQRFRVALVSGSIIVWFGSALVASAAGLGQSDLWQLISRLLGLLAPLVILFAFLPPAWVQRWLRIESIGGKKAQSSR